MFGKMRDDDEGPLPDGAGVESIAFVSVHVSSTALLSVTGPTWCCLALVTHYCSTQSVHKIRSCSVWHRIYPGSEAKKILGDKISPVRLGQRRHRSQSWRPRNRRGDTTNRKCLLLGRRFPPPQLPKGRPLQLPGHHLPTLESRCCSRRTMACPRWNLVTPSS